MGRDTIQLENAVSTISQEYLLEFTSEYDIREDLHPELPGSEDTIVDFPKGKVGVYTKFFEFANYRIPISQLLFDILGHYQIHLSQLSVIGAAKLSFSKRPGKNTPQCYTKPLDSLKNWNNRLFWADERIFPTVVDWRTSAPNDGMPLAGPYSATDVAALDTNQMDLFGLIRNPNPFKVKTRTRPCAAHEVPLLTATASRVIGMEDTTVASGSSGTPSTIEKSPLDFDNENPTPSTTKGVGAGDQAQDGLAHEVPSVKTATTTEVVQEPVLEKEVVAMGPPVNKRRRQRGTDEAEANAPPKVLRKDHATPHPAQSTHGGKSLATIGLEAGSTFTLVAQETSAGAKSVSDQDPLSSSKGTATEILPQYVATTEVNVQLSVGNPDLGKSTSVPSVDGSPGGIYLPGWGVTNNTLKACQDMIDHTVPPGYFSELRHLPNTEFLGQYNMNLARQVAMGSQLRLRFEQEVRLLKEARAKIARRDQRIQVREEEIKKLDEDIKSLRTMETEVHGLRNRTQNLETLLEAELSQQVSNLQAQVTGEERIKATFKEFKKYKDDKVTDGLSGLRLAVMKCVDSTELRQVFADVMSTGIVKGMSEGLKHGVEHEEAKLDLAAIEAYDPEADAKYLTALQALKDLKFPLVDQLEKLKDAPIDLIMASLHLEGDSGEDAPQWICDLHPSSSQLKISVYPEVRGPKDLWSIKEEILLEDSIAANISRAEKKKKCWVVCRLAILLANAATQTEISEDEASSRLLRSKFLPPMYNMYTDIRG
ncbi:hypothetical protein Tco_0969214 [Tanacetum coccineum]